jgi:aminomethyltransferase
VNNSPTLARTPFFDLAIAQSAKMTSFAGWEMPIQFTGITAEHHAVRQQCGIFDVSHMGKFLLSGQQLISHLQPLIPSDLSRLQPGDAQYSVLLNPQGGIIDDIIFYYQGETDPGHQQGVMIVNAATKTRDKAWLLGNLESAPVTLQDVSSSQILLAVQGAKVLEYLQPLLEVDLSQIKPFGHRTIDLGGTPVFLARTGYTGEDGFEIMTTPAIGIQLWQDLLRAGVAPCGLGCRDTLRLEAAMALYGQDIDEQTTPLEAGLGWIVHWDKGDFLGRSILEQQKDGDKPKILVGLEMMGRNIARHGYPVLADGQMVGVVTSGTLSPTLGKPVALAYVSTALGKVGQELAVEIRGKTYPAMVVKKPFYRSPHKPPHK